jgi:site-specific DNA-adenine methylase
MAFYPGGKKRLGREIAETIAEIADDYDIRGYCEPFLGMAGVYRHIPSLLGRKKYLAGDQNEYLIRLWDAVQNGWRPPSHQISRSEYERYRSGKSLTALFYGFASSYQGDFRSGYFGKNNCAKQAEDMIEIGEELRNVKLSCGDYDQFSKLKGYVIYCDIPYHGTRQSSYYKGDQRAERFDHDRFIDWALDMARDNVVLISEYSKPCREAKLVWSHGKEKLFLLKP